jgi:hypothetical protein
MEAGAVSEMQQTSYQEPWERRRCEHTLTGGTRCRRWADREERMCHAHRMYAETWGRSRVDVPLLEDEASILYVLSQTAQALARAAMPPANGLAIIGACRQATRVLALQMERGKLAARHAAAEQRAAEAKPPKPEEAQAKPERREEQATRERCEEPEMAIEVAASEEAECGAPEQGCEEAVKGNPFEEARAAAAARTAAEKAEREEREGPTVQLPRFRREDLEEQWANGKDRPFRRNENNMYLSHDEAQAMMQWKRAHREIVNGQDQRMLDVYFGRAESRPDDPWMRC